MEQTYFRKGFGLKGAIEGALTADYHSRVVDRIRESGYVLEVGDLTFRLAGEFGFCYGVDRAVEYAYETRTKFPDKRTFLVGEIIHNPHVNQKLAAMGVEFLHRPEGQDGEFDFSAVNAGDVVILPAFGVPVRDFERLRAIGCVLVDTTCGSVLNVWKRVEVYARDGFTALIHGKNYHEETKATSSQVNKYPGGKYLVVRDMSEARVVCDYIEGAVSRDQFLQHFEGKMTPNFDPARDLQRVGVANQTTMLSGDFRTFDTICSATQERQDAVLKLIAEPLDLMVVIGGYNSSNTTHLAAICSDKVTTYHIEDAACIDVEDGSIRHRPVGMHATEERHEHWLPEGRLTIGITAGASTPNNKIGETIERIAALRG